MTQDEMKRLLINIIDDVESIIWYQQLLKIAVEQLNDPGSDIVDRVDVLLFSYLQNTEPHFDDLKRYFSYRDEVETNYLTGN